MLTTPRVIARAGERGFGLVPSVMVATVALAATALVLQGIVTKRQEVAALSADVKGRASIRSAVDKLIAELNTGYDLDGDGRLGSLGFLATSPLLINNGQAKIAAFPISGTNNFRVVAVVGMPNLPSPSDPPGADAGRVYHSWTGLIGANGGSTTSSSTSTSSSSSTSTSLTVAQQQAVTDQTNAVQEQQTAKDEEDKADKEEKDCKDEKDKADKEEKDCDDEKGKVDDDTYKADKAKADGDEDNSGKDKSKADDDKSKADNDKSKADDDKSKADDEKSKADADATSSTSTSTSTSSSSSTSTSSSSSTSVTPLNFVRNYRLAALHAKKGREALEVLSPGGVDIAPTLRGLSPAQWSAAGTPH